MLLYCVITIVALRLGTCPPVLISVTSFAALMSITATLLAPASEKPVAETGRGKDEASRSSEHGVEGSFLPDPGQRTDREVVGLGVEMMRPRIAEVGAPRDV